MSTAIRRSEKLIDPATGRQVPSVEVPPPDLPENEPRRLKRAPKLPALPRDRDLAELGKAHVLLRQEDEELREAVMRARHGEPGASIRGLREDRVREVPRDALGGEAARCWLALSGEERADTAVMAPTHEIRRQTNDSIRAGLAEEGTLHGRTLDRTLGDDRSEIERVRNERTQEQSRRRDRSQDRGFSM